MDNPPPIGFPSQPQSVGYSTPGTAPRGAGWNMAIGIISIVLACLGILLTGLGLINMAFMHFSSKNTVGFTTSAPTAGMTRVSTTGMSSVSTAAPTTAPAMTTGAFGPVVHLSSSTMALTLTGSLLNLAAMVLLLVAGIQMIRRRRNGRSLHMLWAMAKFPIELLLAAGAFLSTRETLAAMAGQVPGFSSAMMNTAATFAVIMGLVMGLAYPIFLLIALSNRKVRAAIDSNVTTA